ncbi:MAG: PKD domain-containing protein [Sphingomonadales bacterium]|nr:PKD domain-containing protein [Sphingomonadales bacterium]
MKTIKLLFLGVMGAFALSGCEDEPSLGTAPTTADAEFTYTPTAANPNVIEFDAKNKNLIAKWDFGNGTKAEGPTVQGSFPLKGTYVVTLTVFNSGGSASTSQTITIAQDDATLLNNPLYTILTGGNAGKGYKTWVIDSTRDGHFGVGPNPVGAAGNYPEWWAAKKNDKSNTGLYNDQFVFRLKGFGFDQMTKGDVYVNSAQAANFPGATLNVKTDYTAPYADQTNQNWTLTLGADTTLTVSGKSFIGYYTGVNTYKVVRMSENELFLRYVDAANSQLAWYIRLVPDTYPVDNGTDPTYTLPVDFENVEPKLTTFGGSTTAVISNPKSSGINTSSKVLETVHGNETWAGFFINLTNKLDFSSSKTISVKVYAPATGVLRMKLENGDNTAEFVEKDVDVTVANQWVEVSIDFSDAAAGKYNRLVLFPGWSVANAGTFYVDDIKQK